MSQSVDPTFAFWHSEWERVSIQLDSFNNLIRMNFDTYCRLGGGGRDYFVQQASTLLSKPAEFFVDHSNSTRVLLANRWDLSFEIPCRIEPWAENGLPRFYPTIPNPLPIANPYAVAGSSSLASSSLSPTTAGNTTNSPASSQSSGAIQLGTPIPDTPSPSLTNQSTHINMEFGGNSNITFGNPWFSTYNQGCGAPHTQYPIPGVGFMPTLNPNHPMPVGAPAYQNQSYSAVPQIDAPIQNTSTTNSGPSSSRKRKSENPLSLPEGPRNGDGLEPARKKRSRKPRNDNDGSKRTCNAFLLFRKEQHAIIAAEHPGIDNGEISRRVSVKWHAFSKLEQDAYYEKADRLSEENTRLHPEARYQANGKQIAKRRRERAARAAAAAAEVAAADLPAEVKETAQEHELPQEQIEGPETLGEQIEHLGQEQENVNLDSQPPQQFINPAKLQKQAEP
ncbi:hypothetical protein GQX73_g4702 [Xylaria multiplex]|uniref:HMG box domain-containing protein n=1 Tax=Xylaria multiplex TaxID=323545 RepID=A0A7C8N5P4_9PEZI|nr:hypothetical protein GQX73_g4702 [Xylaria multiplex]